MRAPLDSQIIPQRDRSIIWQIAAVSVLTSAIAMFVTPVVASPATQSATTGFENAIAEAQTIALAGTFVAAEAPTTGTVQIVTEGGHRYLELDAAFSTTDQAPDLHVLIDTAQTPPSSYATLGSAINLGSLQQTSGAQRYPIPDVIDVAEFKSVVIWCRMANATIGYAVLGGDRSATIQ